MFFLHFKRGRRYYTYNKYSHTIIKTYPKRMYICANVQLNFCRALVSNAEFLLKEEVRKPSLKVTGIRKTCEPSILAIISMRELNKKKKKLFSLRSFFP